MKKFSKKLMVGALIATTALAFSGPLGPLELQADAQIRGGVKKETLGAKAKRAWRNPMVKKGTIGAGIGLGTAAVTDGSLGKGALVGAGAGVAVGAMDKSKFFGRHPLGRRAGKGAVIGAGAGSIVGGVGALPGAAIGAGAGSLIHYIKKSD